MVLVPGHTQSQFLVTASSKFNMAPDGDFLELDGWGHGFGGKQVDWLGVGRSVSVKKADTHSAWASLAISPGSNRLRTR
jgi:hypothetical protein